jgi:uncharacterized protein Usg
MKYFGQYNKGLRYTSIKVIYSLPDYQNVLNEFWWQTFDIPPKYPRAKKFVDYWNEYIEGIIKHLEIGHKEKFGSMKWTNCTNWFEL